MASVKISQLKSGIIFGDNINKEYLYLPAGECAADNPVLVYEHDSLREDVPFKHALDLITWRSLKPVTHPLLGKNSF